MKSRLNYKSKRTIIIVAIIIALIAIASTGIYMFTKGNDEAKAFTEGNTTIGGSEANPSTEGNNPTENPGAEEQPTTQPNIEPEQGSQNNNEGTTGTQTPNTQGTTNRPVSGTTTSTTNSNVPNGEYVTERQEEITIETGSLYVGWAPQTVAALTSTINLVKEETQLAYSVNKVATAINGKAIVRDENGEILSRAKIGDVVTYVITIENTGNVTLKNIHVVDSLVNYDETINVLAIGDKKEIIVKYTVEKEKVEENDTIINTVEVTVPDVETEETTKTEEIIPVNPYITISGEKIWKDYNNQENTRAKIITVEVLKGDEVVDTIKTTATKDWKYISKELPRYSDKDATEPI